MVLIPPREQYRNGYNFAVPRASQAYLALVVNSNDRSGRWRYQHIAFVCYAVFISIRLEASVYLICQENSLYSIVMATFVFFLCRNHMQ